MGRLRAEEQLTKDLESIIRKLNRSMTGNTQDNLARIGLKVAEISSRIKTTRRKRKGKIKTTRRKRKGKIKTTRRKRKGKIETTSRERKDKIKTTRRKRKK